MGTIEKMAHNNILNQSGVTIWLTGLSGAGKTTIAHELESILKKMGFLVEVLDGDVIRQNLSKGLGFSREDRDLNVLRVGYVANLLCCNGVIVIASLISPYRIVRDELRSKIDNFVEVYINAPLEICETRDVKGLYAKARAGQLKSFTGIDDPYEEPLTPEITCNTAEETIDISVEKIFSWLNCNGYLT